MGFVDKYSRVTKVDPSAALAVDFAEVSELAALYNQLANDRQEIHKTFGTIKALEDLALLAQEIGEPTDAEKRLMTMVGDSLLVGQHTQASQMIPAFESFSTGAGTKEFGLRLIENVKKLIRVILEFMKEFYKKARVFMSGVLGFNTRAKASLESTIDELARKEDKSTHVTVSVSDHYFLKDPITEDDFLGSLEKSLDTEISYLEKFNSSYILRVEKLLGVLIDGLEKFRGNSDILSTKSSTAECANSLIDGLTEKGLMTETKGKTLEGVALQGGDRIVGQYNTTISDGEGLSKVASLTLTLSYGKMNDIAQAGGVKEFDLPEMTASDFRNIAKVWVTKFSVLDSREKDILNRLDKKFDQAEKAYKRLAKLLESSDFDPEVLTMVNEYASVSKLITVEATNIHLALSQRLTRLRMRYARLAIQINQGF